MTAAIEEFDLMYTYRWPETGVTEAVTGWVAILGVSAFLLWFGWPNFPFYVFFVFRPVLGSCLLRARRGSV